MPTATIAALATVLLALPSSASAPASSDTIKIEFFDPFGRSSYQFAISDDAYIAIFEIRPGRVELTYPAVGEALRHVRYSDATQIPAPDNHFAAGRHLLPQRAGRGWWGRTENGYLLKGQHILVVASKVPFTFERLNDLFVDQGETLRRHNSLGAEDDFTRLLIETITPGYDAGEWGAYLHWIRDK